MKDVEATERAGSVATCNPIISNTIGIGVEEEDRKATWVADVEECKKRAPLKPLEQFIIMYLLRF